MLGRMNQRLKNKSSADAYSDLDKQAANGESSSTRNFMFPSGGEMISPGLGYSIEMSAAGGSGVVPDGLFFLFSLNFFTIF